MKTAVSAKELNGEITAISSKSMVHRLLIASSVSDEPTVIYFNGLSDDIKATINCLTSMGANINEQENIIFVQPIKNAIQNPILNCVESGSTLRFLLPFAKALSESPTFLGSGRLPERPLSPLKEQMEDKGCIFSERNLPFSVGGKLQNGIFRIKGDISSQFITGLLLALPLLKGKSKIVLTSPLKSKKYVDMTVEVLNLFKIFPQKTECGFILDESSIYKSPHSVNVEGDWSNAAFWLAAGAIKGKVTVKGLNLNSSQGDKFIINLLKKMGTKVVIKENSITVFESELKGTQINADDIPDLVPILAVLACKAKGVTIIKNAERLKFKESNRLFAIQKCLSSLGADICETSDGLIINGGIPLKGGTVNSFNDHRIVMSMAVASLLSKEEIIIENSHAVNKSYPRFFEDFVKLGGISNVL